MLLAFTPKPAIVMGNTQENVMNDVDYDLYDSQSYDGHICSYVRDWAVSRIGEIVQDRHQVHSDNANAIAIEDEFREWLEYDGHSDLEYLCIDNDYIQNLYENT